MCACCTTLRIKQKYLYLFMVTGQSKHSLTCMANHLTDFCLVHKLICVTKFKNDLAKDSKLIAPVIENHFIWTDQRICTLFRNHWIRNSPSYSIVKTSNFCRMKNSQGFLQLFCVEAILYNK